ncbi:MAG: rhodanese-like domain-containing protein [Myxococcales bacterium]|nr:rhodanese-like domain-containing protein [Myxococcales bacterium]
MFSEATSFEAFVNVDPQTLYELGNTVRIVDVREPDEFVGELGHVRGAILAPLASVGAAARAFDPDEPVVVVCRSGGRSARAAEALCRLGFTKVMNLQGGMLAWNALRLPVETAR